LRKGCVATGATVLGFTTLECLGAQAAGKHPEATIAVAIDAKRGEVYLQLFDRSLKALTDGALLSVGEAEEIVRHRLVSPAVFVGSGAALVRNAFGGHAQIEMIARIDLLVARRAALPVPTFIPGRCLFARA
jgi:tRNA threonylcarbamoyladenosine biosynthesis protein TsaB